MVATVDGGSTEFGTPTVTALEPRLKPVSSVPAFVLPVIGLWVVEVSCRADPDSSFGFASLSHEPS